MRQIFFLIFIAIISSSCSFQEKEANKYKHSIIPEPKDIQYEKGNLMLGKELEIYTNGNTNKHINNLAIILPEDIGNKLKTTKIKEDAVIKLSINAALKTEESYQLKVDNGGVEIIGADMAGVFYGIQTLKQLLFQNKKGQWSVPFVKIEDQPRFAWRGVMLDVSRHFYSVEFIKKYIDALAFYKINTLHWHLTDDQGWRIEIKKYPKLTQISSWRKETLVGHYSEPGETYNGKKYGGYYSQEEIKDIINHAATKQVTIVPEIEMPGHSQAVLAAYPELACISGPFEVSTIWGVHKEVFCPNEATFEFLENVLAEVIELFPSKYIHVGGDECPKDRWEASQFCQDLIKKEGLKDEHELQSYFIKRMEKFINSKGKKIIGWDEILEGGLSSTAAVMSWRGTEGGIAAAKQGNDVVMTPSQSLYFDYYQSKHESEPLAIGGFLPLENVYKYEPIPDTFTKEQSKHIIGVQANVWTEYIKNSEQVEYMTFPRALALSEIAWSAPVQKNWDTFSKKVTTHMQILEDMHINTAKSVYDISFQVISDENKNLAIQLSSPIKAKKINYVLGGEKTNLSNGLVYNEPIQVNKPHLKITTAFFNDDRQLGKTFTKEFNFKLHKGIGVPVNYIHSFSKTYQSNKDIGLTDGLLGTTDHLDGNWQGFEGTDFEVEIDLEMIKEVGSIQMNFLHKPNDWIFFPETIKIEISADGEHYQSIEANYNKPSKKIEIVNSKVVLNSKVRYIKIIAKNPDSEGNKWLFIDEIIID